DELSSISQEHPVHVFVGHAFEPAPDYHRVFEYLESSHTFYYRNCSELQAAGDERQCLLQMREQIAQAEVLILPASLYQDQPQWVDFQLECARVLDKPVIVLENFGVKAPVPAALKKQGAEVIDWDVRALVDAIRRQARHEETTRWDVIDFKLD